MARNSFGGGIGDWTFLAGDDVTVGSITGKAAAVAGGITVTFWTDRVGGAQYDDLLDVEGQPATAIVSSDGTDGQGLGQIPTFWGPDGVAEMWASANDGPRARIVTATATDVAAFDQRVTTVETQASLLDGRVGAVESGVAPLGHNAALRKWYGMLANRNASITSIVVMGDSIVEGVGSNNFVRRRFQQVLQAELRARFQPTAVVGALVPYISASPRTIFYPSDYGRTGTAGVGEASYGLGRRAAVVPTGESVTFTLTGTRAKLYARKGPEVGKYRIVLNGGAPTVVDGVAASGSNSQVIWDSGTLASGTHTVQVSRDASTTLNPGSVYPEGLMTYNGDESSGLRVVDAAKTGARVSDFTGLNGFDWFAAFGAIEGKGLLIMPWGANDSTFGTTPAAFRADVESLISAARSNGFDGSVLLVHLPKRGNAVEQTWMDYRLQLEAIAAADPDAAFLNLRTRMPDQGTPEATALGLYADEVHLSEKGQGWMADQIANAILPR